MTSHDGFAETLTAIPPEPIRDSLRDILKDAIVQWPGPVPHDELELKAAFFQLIERGFEQAREVGVEQDVDSLAVSEQVSEILFRLKDLLATRLHIYALLICLGKISGSEEEIARELGVTKQAVSKSKIIVQEFFNLPCRAGRKDESRAKFSTLALSRSPKQVRWTGQKYFARL